MRIKEFFVRVGFTVPVALWVVFIFMMLVGIVANGVGAGPQFYCTVYCKLALYLAIAVITAVVCFQAKICIVK